MTQGISSLPGAQQPQQPQQPQAPGQAMPFQAMPAQQPQTPMGMTGQLQNLPPQQLLQMFANPADKTPKWAVVTAYAKAIEQQRLEQLASGQQAMQQNQMQAQQPPIAAQVMMQQPTQMARHGGIMHGYSGGGAVAFEDGGKVQRFQSGAGPQGITTGFAPEYQAMRAAGIDISPYDSPEVRADKIRRFEEFKRTGVVPPASPVERKLPAGAEEDRRKLAELASGVQKNVLLPAGAAIADVATAIPRGLAGAYNSTVVRGLRALGIPIEYLKDFAGDDFSSMTPYYDRAVRQAQQQEQATQDTTQAAYQDQTRQKDVGKAPAAPPAAETIVPAAGRQPVAAAPARGFPEPQQATELRRRLDEQNRVAREQAKLTDEERAARGGLDALSAQIIAERKAEEARRLAQAEARMGEAKARAERNPLEDVAFIGQMLKGARGARTFGAGISGAGIGAGEAETARREALRKAEEKYDLSRNEIANLANLRQQVQMDQAKVVEARAYGDANKIRAAETQAAASGVDLAKYEQDLGLKGRELDLKAQELAQKAEQTRLAAIQMGDVRLANAISYQQARVQQARDGRAKVLTQFGPNAALYQIDPGKFAQEKPEIFKQMQAALKDYEDKVVAPADNQLSALISQASERASGGRKVVDWSNIR